MAAEQITKLRHCGLLGQNMVPLFKIADKNFFSLPNELFFLNIGHGAITVYAHLLYCEDRDHGSRYKIAWNSSAVIPPPDGL